MKRKTALIHLGLTSAMALTLSCRSTAARRCVDQTNRVVENRYCENAPIATGGYYPFRWYYGGNGFGSGMFVSGGSYYGSPGSSSTSQGSGPSTSTSGTTRGGFGSAGEGTSSSSSSSSSSSGSHSSGSGE